jgi:hypothetical protein
MSTPLTLGLSSESVRDQIEPKITKGFWLSALVILGLAWSLQAYAIWSVTYLPLIDLPNHMARHYLEAVKVSGGDVGPFYNLELRVLPNLGADLILPFLILALGPQVACKLFVTLAVFLYWLGPAWFIAQQGGYRLGALAATLLLLPLSFSAQFYWGFLNFYSGFGLAFLVLVHFTWIHRQERLPIGQLMLHASLVTLLFLWHLAPWMIYVVVAACFLLARSAACYWKQGGPRLVLYRGLSIAATLVPSFGLFAYYSLHNRGVSPQAGFDWGTWTGKAMLLLSLFRSYDRILDIIVSLGWLAVVLIWFTQVLRLHLPPAQIWLGLLALVGVYLILPYRLGGTMDADTRILPAILVFAVAWLGQLAVRHFRAGAVLLTLCIVVRFGSVVAAWNGLDAELGHHAESFAAIDERSRVMRVMMAPFSKDYPARHFLAWILLSKNVLVSDLFAAPDQQPLAITWPTPSVARRQGPSTIIDERAADHYDFLWVYNPVNKPLVVPDSFVCVYSDRGVSVWRAPGHTGVSSKGHAGSVVRLSARRP